LDLANYNKLLNVVQYHVAYVTCETSHVCTELSCCITPCTTNCYVMEAPCGFWGCKNRPASFLGWMSYKVTKPGSVCPLT